MPALAGSLHAEFFMREKEFLGIVIRTALKHGWKFYHAPYIKGIPRIKGFPDLVLVRDRVLFRELKTVEGELKQEQEEWIRRLQNAGSDAKVWRPNNMNEIEAELSVELGEEDEFYEDELEERERQLAAREEELEEQVEYLEYLHKTEIGFRMIFDDDS